jgi:two-component system phosphate regulon sensor histidine kinase PhoR
MKKTLFLRIFMGYAAVIVLVAVAVVLFAPPLMRTYDIAERSASLEHMAALIEPAILPFLTSAETAGLPGLVDSFSRGTGARITVIDPTGEVLADSDKDAREMENHLYRPEIQRALRGEVGMSIRPSSTLKTDMMYVCVPVRAEGRVVGALRLSLFMKNLDALLGVLRIRLLRVLGLTTLLALGIAFFLSRSVSRPLREVIDASSRVAAGDFDVAVSARRSGEFKRFALSFNAMTSRIKAMFEEIRVQNEEIQSILAAIQDGLALLDMDGRILLANASFRRLAGQEAPEGRHIWEVVRSSSAAELVRLAREGGEDVSGEISIGDRTFFGRVSRLEAAERLVVSLHDVTELRALEKTKRDFVVNVSHELKTPLTAIKGFVETMEPRAETENRPYLEIIRRNTDRLIAIVEDLLVLSKLETPGLKPDREPVDVRAIAGSILKLFERRAGEKGIRLVLEAPEDLPAVPGDPAQIEGLLLNLVDNAVKFTDQGAVAIRLGRRDGRLHLEVQDTGMGIDAVHLPHIFERFYVADKSRSKKLGGTGLGLAIVKHVVQAHRGEISVRSRLGEGTTVSISLPLE